MSAATAERARKEAAAWFARLSQLSVTTETLREFRDWRRDPANVAAYNQVSGIWEAAGGLDGDPGIRAATAAALRRRSPSREGIARGLKRRLVLVFATASLAVVVIGGWMLDHRPTYRTGLGEQRLVTLADGSRLRLNTDSAVRVRLGTDFRRVELRRGEAFFEVAHDAARPFIVSAYGAQVRAVGTKFDVRREPGSVQVTLLEGRVAVADAAGGSATLAPNQQLTVKGQHLSRPASADAAEVSSWTRGRLTFRNTPLAQAVAEVNRYSARKLVLGGPPALGDRLVSGVFDVGDSAAFIAAVGALFDLSTTPDGQDIRLAPRR